MSYRTLLVSLNDQRNAEQLSDIAVSVASKGNAHVIGLHVIPALDVPDMIGSVGVPSSIYDDHKMVCDRRAKEIRAVFEHKMQVNNIPCEWREITSWSTQISNKVVEHARCVDLSIVAQGDREGPENGQADLPEYLLMESGRPVLIVPKNCKQTTVGDYPLIAWNSSRESARAAFDAAPLLQHSKEVITLWINPEFASEMDGDIAGSEIATSLARYDIPVKASHAFPSGSDVGEVLIHKIQDNGSDLLIMGGYGRSRLREYVFGGATRKILNKMNVPVFMSH